MKRDKRGFTLIELLAVLTIIALLLIIAVPNIMKMNDRIKERGLDEKIESIKKAAALYAQNNSNKIKNELGGVCNAPSNTCKCDKTKEVNGVSVPTDCKYIYTLTVKELVEKGAFKSEKTSDEALGCHVSDPTNNARCLDCLKVEIHLDDEYKSADAYINKDDIETLDSNTTCTTNVPDEPDPIDPTDPINPSPTPATFTILFDANGGSTTTTSKTVTSGSKYGNLPVPVRSGFTFDGWYTEVTGGTKITEESIVSIIDDQTLYAHWTSQTIKPGIAIQITFNCPGFTTAPSYMNKNSGDTYGTLPVPINNGDVDIYERRFEGWYTENDEKITANSIVPAENQTLTCKFVMRDPSTEVS